MHNKATKLIEPTHFWYVYYKCCGLVLGILSISLQFFSKYIALNLIYFINLIPLLIESEKNAPNSAI